MWTRREVLARLAAVAAGGLAAGSPLAAGCGAGATSLTPVSIPRDGRIVVIGAGAAGASCARRLRDAGRDVVVLEARDRVGGRIHSVDVDGVTLEYGAAWLHGQRDHPARPWLEAAGVGWQVDPEDYVGVDGAGARLTRDDMDRLWRQTERFVSDLGWTRRTVGDGASVSDGVDAWVADAVDAADRDRVAALLRMSVALAYSGDAAAQALDAFDEDESWPGSEALVAGGFGRMFGPLLDGIDVRTGMAARQVTWTADGARVHVDGDVLDAAAVVVAVPLGVLKAGGVRFDPPLPTGHVDALTRLGVGTFEKVFTRWSVLPGREGTNVLALPRDGLTGVDHIDLRPLTGGVPWLASLVAGDDAVGVPALTDDAARTWIEASLAPRGGAGRVDRVHRTNWAGDPWAGGAWSFVPVGASMRDYDALAEPVGDVLLFAGEATSREWPGTVHGAMKSGHREARRILGG